MKRICTVQHRRFGRAAVWIALVVGYPAAQELQLGVCGKQYAQSEEVWASVTVNGVSVLPGAFAASLRFDTSVLAFQKVLPPESGPFTLTPAVSVAGNTVTLAGFQGVDNGKPVPYTVMGLLSFSTRKGAAHIDSTAFAWNSAEVYGVDGRKLALKSVVHTGTVLKPQKTRLHAKIPAPALQHGYLTFSLPGEGKTTVCLYTLKGTRVALPLWEKRLSEGTHAVAVGNRLGAGIFLVTIKSTNYSATYRIGVVR